MRVVGLAVGEEGDRRVSDGGRSRAVREAEGGAEKEGEEWQRLIFSLEKPVIIRWVCVGDRGDRGLGRCPSQREQHGTSAHHRPRPEAKMLHQGCQANRQCRQPTQPN